MMSKWMMLLVCFGVACGSKSGDDSGEEDDTDHEHDTDMVMSEMGPGTYDPGFATSDDYFTLMAAPVAGTSPHGTVQIWYSTNLEAMISGGGSFTAPEGSVSVKTFDNGDTGTVVMIKKEAGYDADNGDWYYEMRGADDSLMDSGKIEMCIGCHVGFADTDYLGGTTLR